ncbi:MAG: hypothetical protein QOG19_1323 [Mycobacterium sp.]|nr:hypothetical protein [Mycobacterium sp.]
MVSENTRATDDDRNDTCQVLDSALSDGQLSTEEHRERVSTATRALTLGELWSLTADLQIHRPEVGRPVPKPKPPTSRRDIGIAAALALLFAGSGIAWGLHRNTTASPTAASKTTSTSGVAMSISVPSTPGTTKPLPPPELLTLSGLTGVLAQMRTQFGDTLGYQLNIYQDKAMVLRPDTANPRVVVEWIYRAGSWMNRGPSTAAFSGSGVGDLSKFDVQAVLGVSHAAPQTLELYDAPDTFLAIESRKDGSLYLDIHVSDNTRRSGSIVVTADGAITEIDRPRR